MLLRFIAIVCRRITAVPKRSKLLYNTKNNHFRDFSAVNLNINPGKELVPFMAMRGFSSRIYATGS
jgi:hypothetical protein